MKTRRAITLVEVLVVVVILLLLAGIILPAVLSKHAPPDGVVIQRDQCYYLTVWVKVGGRIVERRIEVTKEQYERAVVGGWYSEAAPPAPAPEYDYMQDDKPVKRRFAK